MPKRTVTKRQEEVAALAWTYCSASRLQEPGEVFEMDLLYTPEFRALRAHPDFLPLLERLGIVDYWEQAGCTFDGNKAVCTAD